MDFLRGLFDNPWLLLGVKTLVITFVGRFILDAATSWTIDESRPGVVACVLGGWCAAVIFGSCLYAGGLGAIASVIACLWHIVELLRERASIG